MAPVSALDNGVGVFPSPETAKTFDCSLEEKIYSWLFFLAVGYFKLNLDSGTDPFVIPMPPPNVTGSLHMGHAMFVTLEDIMTRYRRMRPTLWIPGTDHAGKATHLVVEKMLVSEGIKRSDLSREDFTKRGRKMSKSLGNVVDPLDTISEFGTDALRFTLSLGTAGQDLNLSTERLKSNKAFTNKLWNAGKFLLQNLPNQSDTASWDDILSHKFDQEEDVLKLPLAECCGQAMINSSSMMLPEKYTTSFGATLQIGWQPGPQETAGDWDDEWDKFQEEGFTFVKEFTLDVQNVIAPSKEKSRRVKTTATVEGQIDPSSPHAKETRESPSNADGHAVENGVHHNDSETGAPKSANATPKSAPQSPAAPSSAGSPKDSTSGKHSLESPAMFDRDSLSDHEATGSVHSGDRTSDEPAWGTSENDDLDSVWGFNATASSPWEIDHDRLRDDNFLSGSKTDFGLNPIRTGSQHGTTSPRRNTFFDESVPSTPLYTPGPQTSSHQRSIFFDESVPSTPLYTSGVQPERSSVFFDESVPSTPLYGSAFSPTERDWG
ncbi:hypothetical protein MLD38_022791 [Melastoma candidum]|uniref:Uncharacterized protein n=1 Tax=Melastoma candidum TaxID=119954 RepID=A0ACB9QJS9_9MYRT|nr:hypothetical protein MLD38_022791 [Melastoma candidum]